MNSVPPWVPTMVAVVAAAAWAGLPNLLNLEGWKGWVARAAFAIVTVAAVVATVVQHRQSEREKRLDVSVDVAASPLRTFADVPSSVEAFVAAERVACMEPLTRHREQQRRKERQARSATSTTEIDGLSMGYLRDLKARDAAGESLTDEEQNQLAVFKVKLAAFGALRGVMSKMPSNSVLSQMSASSTATPEERTPAAYEAEVERYLARVSTHAERVIRESYLSDPVLALRVQLHNPTSRTLQDVEVEIFLPGEVSAHEELSVPLSGDFDLPSRPRAFNKPKRARHWLASQLIAPMPTSGLDRFAVGGGPRIDNSGSARVTFEPMNVRAESTTHLPPIWLITTRDTGSVLSGTWSATANNAEGKVTGTFEVRVSYPFEASSILKNLRTTESPE